MATPRTRDIVLTDNAHKIRRLLLDAASSGDQSAWANIELRFAGGCVRDMLLGIESNDIDVAISTKTGMEVAILFQMYLENPANLAKHGLTDDDIGKTYKVEANPEKSKHLETATMRVCGIDLDFVNLRKEVYKDDSRTPEMEFATAEEDAYRRDAKINALFYNLHTERIEDFVGGLDDLDNKIISTPLEPKKTFVDDPLRVLRLIRFSTRLNFIIEEQTRYFMSDSDVVDALKKKISRERVGIEFDKMIKGNNPMNALLAFDELGLYSTIFTDDVDPTIPPLQSLGETDIPTTTWANAYQTLFELLEQSQYTTLRNYLFASESDIPKGWLLAALAPLSAAPPNPPPKNKKAKPEPPYAARVARTGIKQTNKVVMLVQGCVEHCARIASFKNEFKHSDTPFINKRDIIGMAIRRWEERGDWKLQVLWCILVECMAYPLPNKTAGKSTDAVAIAKAVLVPWTRFFNHLADIHVLDAHIRKPIVDGKLLQKELGVKAGIWMKGALDVCMEYQFRNPQVNDPSAAIEEVRGRAEELKIPLP